MAIGGFAPRAMRACSNVAHVRAVVITQCIVVGSCQKSERLDWLMI